MFSVGYSLRSGFPHSDISLELISVVNGLISGGLEEREARKPALSGAEEKRPLFPEDIVDLDIRFHSCLLFSFMSLRVYEKQSPCLSRLLRAVALAMTGY